MKTVSILVLAISAACCCSLLLLSLWPGGFDILVFPAILFAFFWLLAIGILCIPLIVLIAIRLIRGQPKGPPILWGRAILVSVVLFLGLMALSVLSYALLTLLDLWQGNYHILFNPALMAFEIPVGILLLILAVREVIRKPEGSRASLACWMAAIALPILSVGLVLAHVPLRLAFVFYRPSFEPLVESAPASEYGGEALNRRIGIWCVDEYAADPRGGVYFRVGTGSDFLDRISYGFAFRPNSEGSPFGNAHYSCSHLIGEWFYFRASDDY